MGRTDEASIESTARAGRLFQALTDPAARASWLPPAGMTGRMETFDLRVGGGYRMTLTYDDASGAPGKSAADHDTVEATFVDLVEDERVVEAVEFVADDPDLAGTMTMTWSLTPSAGGTTVTITARDVPVGIDAAAHQIGLRSSLEQLSAYVEQSPGRSAQRIEPGA